MAEQPGKFVGVGELTIHYDAAMAYTIRSAVGPRVFVDVEDLALEITGLSVAGSASMPRELLARLLERAAAHLRDPDDDDDGPDDDEPDGPLPNILDLTRERETA